MSHYNVTKRLTELLFDETQSKPFLKCLLICEKVTSDRFLTIQAHELLDRVLDNVFMNSKLDEMRLDLQVRLLKTCVLNQLVKTSPSYKLIDLLTENIGARVNELEESSVQTLLDTADVYQYLSHTQSGKNFAKMLQ